MSEGLYDEASLLHNPYRKLRKDYMPSILGTT